MHSIHIYSLKWPTSVPINAFSCRRQWYVIIYGRTWRIWVLGAHHFEVSEIRRFQLAELMGSTTAPYEIFYVVRVTNKLCERPPQYLPAPCKLTFDLLTLKVVSESRVTWPTSVPILVFLSLSVLDLGPMYATDRQTSDAHHRLMPLPIGAGNN